MRTRTILPTVLLTAALLASTAGAKDVPANTNSAAPVPATEVPIVQAKQGDAMPAPDFQVKDAPSVAPTKTNDAAMSTLGAPMPLSRPAPIDPATSPDNVPSKVIEILDRTGQLKK